MRAPAANTFTSGRAALFARRKSDFFWRLLLNIFDYIFFQHGVDAFARAAALNNNADAGRPSAPLGNTGTRCPPPISHFICAGEEAPTMPAAAQRHADMPSLARR